MDGASALGAALAAFYAAGSVWFYLHCVRPALLWHRSRWIAHTLLAVISVLPAAALVAAPGNVSLFAMSALTWVFLATAWLSPGLVIRSTGGPAAARDGIDDVFGWLNPAGEHLDVGDLEAAQAQVDEARRHARPETLAYVDLWASLVSEEERRRSGERISRLERLKAIQDEYARLVLGRDRMPPAWEAAIVVVVAAVALVSVVDTSRW